MIVVDASAVVPVLSGETDRDRVNAALAVSATSLMSAANHLECSIVPVDRAQADEAFDAWPRCGKGRRARRPLHGAWRSLDVAPRVGA